MKNIIKNKVFKFLTIILVFLFIISWFLFGWLIPPEVEKARAATQVYNFEGVDTSNDGIDPNPIAIEHDSDVFPWTIDEDQNDSATPNDNEYSRIWADNTEEWRTDDPREDDEMAITFRFFIKEKINAITNIEITWNGNTDGSGPSDHSIWLRKDGFDEFGGTNTWVQLGLPLSIPPDVDTDLTRNLTADYDTYINPTTGQFEFVVTTSLSDESMRTNYIQVKVSYIVRLTGFAWSENIGWISFNCESEGDCTHDYSVNFEPDTFNFSGFAWSENVGWISFEEAGVTPDDSALATCPGPIGCQPVSGCTACLDGTNVLGWAKILALGNDGWIRLDDDDTGDANDYGVSITMAGAEAGDFNGWAWNSNLVPEVGIGWVSFNCNDYLTCSGGADDGQACDGSNCGAPGVCVDTCVNFSDYKVKLADQLIISPTIASVEPLVSDSCSVLVVDWSPYNGFGQEGFRIFRENFSPFTPNGSSPGVGNCVGDVLPGILSFPNIGLGPEETYYYIVSAYNDTSVIEKFSAERSDITNSVCEVSGSSAGITGECPDTVNLSWDEPITACTIDSYEVARCQCDDVACSSCISVADPFNNGFATSTLEGGGCESLVFPTGPHPSCDDNTFNDSDPMRYTYRYYRYIFRAHCDAPPLPCDYGGICGDWSDPTEKVQPCPLMPKWREVK